MIAQTWSPAPYRTRVDAQWIDYNGHMRDAFYSLVISLATDDLMDQLGMDAAYRAATSCTLYTLEMHLHFLRELKNAEPLTLRWRLMAVDSKRLHVGVEVYGPRYDDPAASAEQMLLHVIQSPDPKAQPFPAAIAEHLQRWKQAPQQSAAASMAVPAPIPPGSRQILLGRR